MRCPAFTTATRLPGQVLSSGHLDGRGNGNGHGHLGFGGNGHAEFGRSATEPKPAKKTRRARPRMKNGQNQAACHAYGAVLLIAACGFSIEQAIACTTSHTNYVAAMTWILASGDEDLLARVIGGHVDIFDAAKQVRPMVEMKAAYKKLTLEQRITWAAEENPNLMFEEVIVPASVMSNGTKEPVTVEEVTDATTRPEQDGPITRWIDSLPG